MTSPAANKAMQALPWTGERMIPGMGGAGRFSAMPSGAGVTSRTFVYCNVADLASGHVALVYYDGT
jgi:hypothetical protein